MNEKEIQGVIKRIKDRRTEMGLSYQDMENATGISKSTWQRYETGKIRKLSIDRLDSIAKILKTTPAYLMGWEDTKEIDIPQEYLDKYKVTKDLDQREDVLNHAQAFMMDDKVDPDDKQKLFEIVNKLYWEAKATNKEKYSKRKNNK